MIDVNEAVPRWLTRQGYEHLQDELNSLLLVLRSTQPHRGDPIAQDQREWQERRIRQLQELLLTAEVGVIPPDDGIAEPGMVLTVRYDDENDTETFLLAARDAQVHETMEVYSPDSPLGRALLGAREDDTRDYILPDGSTMKVTMIKAQPFHECTQPEALSSSVAGNVRHGFGSRNRGLG